MYNQIEFGDCRETMRRWKEQGIKAQTCVTSPPYFGLRDYGTANWIAGDADCDHVESENKHGGQRSDRNQEGYKKQYKDACKKCGATREDKQIGLEQTPAQYIAAMVEVFRCVRDVLEDDGTLWLNIGDSYCNKDLIGIPWMLAFALKADGWYLRQDIIWHKPNPMPESVNDRCTKAHEYIFLMSKSQKYYYDHDAIKEEANEDSGFAKQRAKGIDTWKYNNTSERISQTGQTTESSTFGEIGKRNKRSVWTVNTKPYKGAHFAVFPQELIEPCIMAGAPQGGVVLDPFMGSGTTAQVAQNLGRQYLGCELNPEYAPLQAERTKQFSLGI
jgi:DNA modification methylase